MCAAAVFGFIQLARGLFGDLGAEARDRIGQIQGTLDFRHQQLEAAIKNNADNIDVFRRTIESLETAIDDIKATMDQPNPTKTMSKRSLNLSATRTGSSLQLRERTFPKHQSRNVK